jgi:hypothetical protein
MKLEHYIELKTVSSNLVYPMDTGKYRYGVKLDKDWVKTRLMSKYNATRINNKYVVEIETHAGFPVLVYNHDDTYWTTEPVEKV